MERIVVDQGRLSVPRSRHESASQISDLAEWALPLVRSIPVLTILFQMPGVWQ
jgi:hypothetical protein